MVFLDSLLFSRHLEEGEKIAFVVHRHWIAVYSTFFKLGLFGIAIPWLFYAMFGSVPMFWGASMWTGIAMIAFFYDFLDWYFDAWLVTTHSIIAVEWKGIFHHNSMRLEYETIEGVGYEISGFFPTMMGYGTLYLEKESGGSTHLTQASNPKEAELEILRAKEEYMTHKTMTNSGELQKLLADMVAHQVKMQGGWKGKGTWGE